MSNTSSIEKWQLLATNQRLIDFTRHMFDRLGVRVTDSGESFTIEQRDDQFQLIDSLDQESVDFVVEIESSQVDRLAEEAAQPELSSIEQYRVVRELFTAATRSILQQRLLRNPWLRRLSGAERVIHVRLLSPASDTEPDTEHTLIYAAKQWLVITGLHGIPQRRFDMTVEQTCKFQRRIIGLLHNHGIAACWRFAKWYRSWRKSVSFRPDRRGEAT